MALLAELITFLRCRCYKDFAPTELRIHGLNVPAREICSLNLVLRFAPNQHVLNLCAFASLREFFRLIFTKREDERVPSVPALLNHFV